MKYSGSGRSISRAESRTHSSSFSPSVAVSVSTQSALAASDTLPAVPGLGRHGEDADEDAVGEAEEAEAAENEVPQKVASELHPKVRNHGEGPY